MEKLDAVGIGQRLIKLRGDRTQQEVADELGIGRGVLGDPSLIARVERYLATGEYLPPPTLEEKIDNMKKLLMREVEFRGENVGVKFVRKFYPYYVNGFQGASRYRGELVMIDDLKTILSKLDYILAENTLQV